MSKENTRLDINRLLDVAMVATGSRSLLSATRTQHFVQALTVGDQEYKLFLTVVRAEEGVKENGEDGPGGS